MNQDKNILDIIRAIYPKNNEGKYVETFSSMKDARDFAESMRDKLVEQGIVEWKNAWDMVFQSNTRVFMTIDGATVPEEKEEVLTAEGVDEKVDEVSDNE